MKICSDCQKKKHETAFYKHPENSDGRQNTCKKCRSEQTKIRNKKKPNGKTYADRIMKELGLE